MRKAYAVYKHCEGINYKLPPVHPGQLVRLCKRLETALSFVSTHDGGLEGATVSVDGCLKAGDWFIIGVTLRTHIESKDLTYVIRSERIHK